MTAPTRTRQPKALSDLAFWLAVRHQAEQQKIADRTAAGLALLWPLLRFDKLDETTPGWLHAVTLQVEPQFRASEEAAFNFVQGAKWAVEPLSDPLKKVDTVFPLKDFQVAMRATGPAAVKRGTKTAFTPPESDSGALFRGIPPEVQQQNLERLADNLMAWGKLNSTGAAVSQTLNGGRGEVQQLVVVDAEKRFKDRQTIGWARFTEDSENGPCYFCALLASRGPFYLNPNSFARSNSKIREPAGNRKTRRSFIGDGPAKVHDHCRCTLRPVYRDEDAMDSRAEFFLRQWNERNENFAKLPDSRRRGEASAMNKFRAVYKRPPKYSENPAVNLAAVRLNRDLVARELGANSANAKWWDRQIRLLESG